MDLEDGVKWVLGVDRRMLVMKEAHENGVIRATELAELTKRSVQNISHAIHELEEAGLVECLTPEKNSWKRYILTDSERGFPRISGKDIFLIDASRLTMM